MTKKLLFVTTILLAVAVVAMAADISGKWVYEQAGRRGGNPTQVTLTLKVDGSTVTGSESRPGRDGNAMETAISEGKVDGSTVTFKVTREMGGNSFTTEYKGTLDGDNLNLEITRPGRGGEPMTTKVTAKRSTT